MPTTKTTETASATPEKIAPEFRITRHPGGSGERKEKLSTLEIRDLWHIAHACDPTSAAAIIDVWHLAHDLKRELVTAFELIVALQGLLQERTAQRDALALQATNDDEAAERIGKAIAQDFGLKRSREYPDRYDTQGGTFTNKGIARRARRHIEEGGQS